MKWTKDVTILWVVIGILLISLSAWGIHIYFKPSIGEVQKEAKEWKEAYELVVKDYTLSKKKYSANIAGIQKKYKNLKVDFDKKEKEWQNVQKPKTSKERLERLRNLGFDPINK